MVKNYNLMFVFRAEDGIRDFHVTGVQTCALPICPSSRLQTAASQIPTRPTMIEQAPMPSGSPRSACSVARQLRADHRAPSTVISAPQGVGRLHRGHALTVTPRRQCEPCGPPSAWSVENPTSNRLPAPTTARPGPGNVVGRTDMRE